MGGRMRLVTQTSVNETPAVSPLVRVVVAVWVAIIAICCGRTLLTPHGGVYPIFAGAARNWVAGEDLYGPLGPDLDRFRYSPGVASLLVPFALLPDGLGGALWRLLNAAVCLGAFAWWVRAVLPPALTAGQRAALFLLIVPLAVGSLNNRQSNAPVLGLLLA